MKCVSILSTASTTQAAMQEVLAGLDDGLGGVQADLTLIFSSVHHADELEQFSGRLLAEQRTRHLMGCTGESIVGDGREVEGTPALSVWSAVLPGVTVQSIRLGEPGDMGPDWTQGTGQPASSALLLLADPFSYRTEDLLSQLNRDVRGLRVIGGMASGSQVPRGNLLLLDGKAFADGAVAVLLGGALSVETVVSQGCRPVGHTMVVTRAEHNVIQELGRRPALEVLRGLFRELGDEDQRRIQEGLHIGRVINEYQGTFQRGDFLVRNVMGADQSGAIQITDVVRVGQTVQFHVRDAGTADEDLRGLLEAHKASPRPAGALLFTCNGRGRRLFHEDHHDIGVIHEVLGRVPTAGFFAMGEIGPIGGQNFLHGYTASIVLFTEPASAADHG